MQVELDELHVFVSEFSVVRRKDVFVCQEMLCLSFQRVVLMDPELNYMDQKYQICALQVFSNLKQEIFKRWTPGKLLHEQPEETIKFLNEHMHFFIDGGLFDVFDRLK